MNEKCNLVTVLLLCCLIFPGNAQEFNWQDLVNRKQYAAVIAHADSLTLADSSNYEIMNAIGQAYEGMLRYQKAYDYYRLCFSMDTTNLDILNILARTATNLGRAEDAERYFHQVLSADSSNFYANYQLARLYFQLGEYEKAVDAYEKLQAQNEDNTVLYRAIGDCYTRMEQYPSATTAYFQAYNLNRENAGLAVALVNSLYRMGASSPDYISEGIGICDTALFYNPGNRQLLRSKGLGLYIVKQFVQADSVYSSLLADGDSTYLTLKYGGASKYYAGLYMPSVDILDMAYEQDTTSVEVCLLLGSALGKTYDRKRAYDLFDRAEKGLEPNRFLVNQLLAFRAETYQKDGRYKEASRLYYEAWKKNPERLDFLAAISHMYSEIDVSKFQSEEDRQRGLFILVLYMNESLKKKADERTMVFSRALLQSFYEDMFFRNVAEETMMDPDGKKSKISIVDLRNLINQLPEESEMVMEIRAMSARSSGKIEEAARLLYRAWKVKVKGTRVELLREIANLYSHPDISGFKNAEELQGGVFAQVTYAKELLKNESDLSNLTFTRPFLESLNSDMSKRGITEQTMLAPDNRKSQLSIDELQSLIQQLPETSDEVKEMIRMMDREKMLKSKK